MFFAPKRVQQNQSLDDEEEEAIELASTETQVLSAADNHVHMTQEKVVEAWRKHGVLGRLHDLNVWYRSSTGRYQEFAINVGRAIPLDSETRWNSRAVPVAVGLSIEKEIDHSCEDHHNALGWNLKTGKSRRIPPAFSECYQRHWERKEFVG